MFIIMKKTILKLNVIVFIGAMIASCQKDAQEPVNNFGSFEDHEESVAAGQQFLSRALFEDYTGAWCGWCPRLAYKFDLMAEHNPRFLFIGNHNGDSFETQWQNTLENEFKISAFPTGTKMRDWNAAGKSIKFADNGNIMNLSDTSQASDYLQNNDSLGISISNAAINGSTVSGKVKVGFGYTYNEPLKIVIELVESNLVLSQSSYYNTNPVGNPFYQKGNPITNFVHENVLRKVSTATLGDAIPASKTAAGKIFTKSFSFNASGYNINNCKVVAFVVGQKTNTKYKGIVNVQWASAGQNKAFEKVN
jgi:hypothetical protein